MIDLKIIIPTLGRINNQITYNGFQNKYKDSIIFVVQSHEYKEFKLKFPKNEVLCLPIEINNISDTRQWIIEKFNNHYVWILDDDLRFRLRIVTDGNKLLTRPLSDDDWDILFNRITEDIKKYVYLGVTVADFAPEIKTILKGHVMCRRITTNHLFNLKKINIDDFKWNRVEFAEDYDVFLQFMSKGIKNKTYYDYYVAQCMTQQKGGCSSQRTIEKHNESMVKLNKLWPRYTKLKINISTDKCSPWYNKEKLGIIIKGKQCYDESTSKFF